MKGWKVKAWDQNQQKLEGKTYNRRKDEELKYVRRPWPVPSFWSAQFPVGSEGRVLFLPPWKSVSYEVKTQEEQHRIERRLLSSFFVAFFLAFLGGGLLYFFWGRDPLFAAILGGYEVALLWLGGRYGLPYWMKPALRELSPHSTEEVLSNWQGRPVRFVAGFVGGSYLFFLLAVYTLIQYWALKAESVLSLSFWALGGLMALGGVWLWGWIASKKRKIGSFLLATLGAFLWAGICIWYHSPSEFRPLGTWGVGNSSPLSHYLGIYQGVFSAYSWDRRLQKAEYRAKGLDLEVAHYKISPSEFLAVKKSLQSSPYVEEIAPQALDKEKKEWAHFRFPSWWPVSDAEKGTRESFAFKVRREYEASQTGWQKVLFYTNSDPVSVDEERLLPGREYQSILFYYPETGDLYVLSEQISYTPYERLKKGF